MKASSAARSDGGHERTAEENESSNSSVSGVNQTTAIAVLERRERENFEMRDACMHESYQPDISIYSVNLVSVCSLNLATWRFRKYFLFLQSFNYTIIMC